MCLYFRYSHGGSEVFNIPDLQHYNIVLIVQMLLLWLIIWEIVGHAQAPFGGATSNLGVFSPGRHKAHLSIS